MVDATTMNTSLDAVIDEALAEFGFPADSLVTLVNVSENSTYRVDNPQTGRTAALRISRPNYHSEAEIESELLWIDALRGAGVVKPPLALAAPSGGRVKSISVKDGPARSVAFFEWLPGSAPSLHGDLEPSFHLLGSLAAKMHSHGHSWKRPESFVRYTCDYDAALGAKAIWGRWQDGLGCGDLENEVLSRLDAEIRRRLDAYGKAANRFGLTHNDLRLANLLLDGEDLYVIDFDDCGFSWYMYDFATAVSFLEDSPRLGNLMSAWLAGYTKYRDLSQADYDIIPTLIMFRRLLLLGWVGSHHEYAQEARDLGAAYTKVTCDLAEKYLAGRFLT